MKDMLLPRKGKCKFANSDDEYMPKLFLEYPHLKATGGLELGRTLAARVNCSLT